MSKVRQTVSALLIITLLSCSAPGQGGKGSWNDVKRLKAGSRVLVRTRTGAVVKGDMRLATDERLFIEVETQSGVPQDVDFDRKDVTEVRSRGSRRNGRNTLIGVAVGLGAGIAIGAGVDAAHKGGDDPGIGKFIFGMLGTTTGLAVGSAIPAGDKVVYAAP